MLGTAIFTKRGHDVDPNGKRLYPHRPPFFGIMLSKKGQKGKWLTTVLRGMEQRKMPMHRDDDHVRYGTDQKRRKITASPTVSRIKENIP